MHGTAPVGEVDRPADLLEQAEGLVDGQRLAASPLEQFGEAHPVDQLGDEVERVADLTPAVDGGDVGMAVESGRHLGLGDESLSSIGVGGVAGVEHLDRRGLPAANVGGGEDHGGTAAMDRPVQSVEVDLLSGLEGHGANLQLGGCLRGRQYGSPATTRRPDRLPVLVLARRRAKTSTRS